MVCRVIASAFLRLFRGFNVPEEPNLLGKLDHGWEALRGSYAELLGV